MAHILFTMYYFYKNETTPPSFVDHNLQSSIWGQRNAININTGEWIRDNCHPTNPLKKNLQNNFSTSKILDCNAGICILINNPV